MNARFRNLFVVATLTAGLCSAANAGDWVFRRSYHSHVVPPEVAARLPQPESRTAYRPAVTGHQRGFAVRGGYRFHRILLRCGHSTDLTIIRESWFNERP